jgi:hypothetical protein
MSEAGKDKAKGQDRDGAPQGGRAARPPGSDMQAEDAGTARSGQDHATVREAPTSSVMKQEHKTDAENGGGSR